MSIINKRKTDKRNTEKLSILLKQGRDLFHLKDLQLLWDINSPATLRRTISRYLKKGVLVPVYRGFYATRPLEEIDPLALGTSALHTYCYVSTETVLAQTGVIFQKIYAYTYCSAKTKSLKIGENTYKSRRLKDDYLYNPAGIVTQPNGKIATAERAVADMLHFNPRYHFDAREFIDWKKVQAIQKAVGYI